MYPRMICFSLLSIFVVAECGVVNIICTIKEDKVFEGVESISADYVQFRLYTRNNNESFRLLTNEENIRHSAYNPNIQTIFIVHGYGGSAGSSGLILLKEFILMHGDSNVILVDWSRGSSEEYMPHAIRNAVASAHKVASFIELLVDTSGTKLNRIHLIGVSLGAQLTSFVGKKLNKVGRITALDPAGPCFSLYRNNHKIHYTDAEFVDVIITNADGFGLKQPSGHVNFVVNGGITQSGCGAVVLKEFRESYDTKLLFLDACSHVRATQLYTDSLKSEHCSFIGYSCSSYQDFLNGECTDCGENRDRCASLGYKAIEYKPKIENKTKVFYLKAAPESPYCLYHYAVFLKLNYSGNSVDETGHLYITLEGSHQETQKLLTPYSESFEAGEEYRYLLTLPVDIGYLKSVKLLWIRTSGGLSSSHELYVDRVKIALMNGAENESSTVFKACRGSSLISGVPQRYYIQTNQNCS